MCCYNFGIIICRKRGEGFDVCGCFCNGTDIPIEELQSIIAEADRKLKAMAQPGQEQITMKIGEVYPKSIVPVIAPNKQFVPTPYPMQWGFKKFDGKGQIINARSETALKLPTFKKPMLERRCLIPAVNYVEWEKVGDKKVKRALKDPQSQLIYMAAIYRYEEDKPLPVFVILTRTAAPDIKFIHDRMPVILGKEAREAWMSMSADITAILDSAIESIQPVA